MTMGIPRKIVKKWAVFGNPQFRSVTDPLLLDQSMEGIVAWSKPEMEEADGWVRVTTIGYFKDINKVKVSETKSTPGQPEKLV